MTRLEANKEILKILEKLVEELPDWRFGQLIYNTGIFSTPSLRWYDPFFDESTETLNKLKKYYDDTGSSV